MVFSGAMVSTHGTALSSTCADYQTQDAGGIGVGCGVWGVACGVWDAGAGCGVRGVGCGVWGAGCGVRWSVGWGFGFWMIATGVCTYPHAYTKARSVSDADIIQHKHTSHACKHEVSRTLATCSPLSTRNTKGLVSESYRHMIQQRHA